MRSFTKLPDNAAGAAVRRAMAQIDKTGIACSRPVSVEGDYLLWTTDVHHSNILILSLLVGMATDTPENAPDWRIPQVISKVPGQDCDQQTVMLRLAHAPSQTTLYDCVKTIIKVESLGDYFEEESTRQDDPKHWHHALRPARYEAARVASINRDEPIDVFEQLRRQAQAERMPPMRRIALMALLSLYNSDATASYFKGRGWNFHAVALGRYCADRIETHPEAFDALIHSFVVYPGW